MRCQPQQQQADKRYFCQHDNMWQTLTLATRAIPVRLSLSLGSKYTLSPHATPEVWNTNESRTKFTAGNIDVSLISFSCFIVYHTHTHNLSLSFLHSPSLSFTLFKVQTRLTILLRLLQFVSAESISIFVWRLHFNYFWCFPRERKWTTSCPNSLTTSWRLTAYHIIANCGIDL